MGCPNLWTVTILRKYGGFGHGFDNLEVMKDENYTVTWEDLRCGLPEWPQETEPDRDMEPYPIEGAE